MTLKFKRLGLGLAAISIAALTVIVLGPNTNESDKQAGNNKKSDDSTRTTELEAPSTPHMNASLGDEGEAGTDSLDSEASYFAELLARADSGDPAAQFQAYLQVGECSGLETSSRVQAQIDAAINVGTPYPDEYVDFLWSMHLKCATIPTGNLWETAEHYLSLARQANYLAAVALQLKNIAKEEGFDAADELVLEILSSGDPAAILNTSSYLAFRRASLPPEQQILTVSPDVLSAALRIWACNLDWESCRPRSRVMFWNCYMLRMPDCDPNVSYLDYMSHAVWTRDVTQKATALAQEWQAAVEKGESLNIFTGEMENEYDIQIMTPGKTAPN